MPAHLNFGLWPMWPRVNVCTIHNSALSLQNHISLPRCDTIDTSIRLCRDRTWYVFCILSIVHSSCPPPNDVTVDYCRIWPVSISHRWRCTRPAHVVHISHARCIYILIGFSFVKKMRERGKTSVSWTPTETPSPCSRIEWNRKKELFMN